MDRNWILTLRLLGLLLTGSLMLPASAAPGLPLTGPFGGRFIPALVRVAPLQGRALRVLRVRHPAGTPVRDVSASRDALFLRSIAGSRPLLAQDLSPSPAARPELVLQIGHSGEVTSVAFSPDGRTLVSASWDQTVRWWDAATGALRRTVAHSDEVFSVAFSPDGRIVVGASKDRTVRLWDARTGALKRTLVGHKGWVTSVVFSPDGALVASGSLDKTVRLWQTQTGKLLRTLKGDIGEVESVAFAPDGRTLVSGHWDRTVRLWDIRTGSVRWTGRGQSKRVFFVAFSPDGKTVASGSDDATVRLWDARTGRGRITLSGHAAHVEAVAFSPDGRRLATGAEDGTARLWDAQAGTLLRTLGGHPGVWSVAFSPDGLILASVGGGTVALWDTTSGRYQRTIKHDIPVWSAVFSPDGRILATAASEVLAAPYLSNPPRAAVYLWDVETWTLQRTLTEPRADAVSVAFSPEGRVIASAGLDGVIRLWDADTGALRRRLTGYGGGAISLISLAFSPDGKMLASGSWTNTARLRDVETGTLRRSWTGHRFPVTAVAFAPDGKTVASASWLPLQPIELRLWDAEDGKLLWTVPGRIGRGGLFWEVGFWLPSVAFSPDGSMIASPAEDNTVHLLDARTGRVLVSLVILPTQAKGEISTEWMSFTPEGYYVRSAKAGRFVRWRIGEKLVPFEAYEQTLYRPDLVQKALRGER